MKMIDVNTLRFDAAGLIPAIVQDADTRVVLMLGYMNREAVARTLCERRVCFFSRSRQRLWTKGEESGHYLLLEEMRADCDRDTLLIKAHPMGPTCHTGQDTCWGERNEGREFLFYLQAYLQKRRWDSPLVSYTARLIGEGINRVAQKVGEEAVELVIEAKDDNRELFLGEAADLMYHYLVLLMAKGYGLEDVEEVLRKRHCKAENTKE